MKYQLIPSSQQTPSQWSGGTTTELFIHPHGSNYQRKDFLLRISSARVEQEESVFTCLEGFDRHLMVLEGELEIIHHGHHQKKMKPFDTDYFMGDWETSAKGCVTDFNLMLAQGLTGELKQLCLGKEGSYSINPEGWDYVAIYIWQGSANVDGQSLTLEKGDFIIFELMGGDEPIMLSPSTERTIMVCCQIKNKPH
ncbi:MAG: HutD family protein [Breznakibacter sp.]|nr:HutD family protein [Breznakibacter sp.]